MPSERRAHGSGEEIELADLNPVGRARFEEDFGHRDQFMPDGPGGPVRIDRMSFAAGWIALAVRYKLRSYLTSEAQRRFGIGQK